MFGWTEKERLLRESWSADALAEELYAMFGERVPNETGAPVKIDLPTGSTVAPIQIGNYDPNAGAPIISVRGHAGELVGEIGLDGDGFTQTDHNGTVVPIGSGGGGSNTITYAPSMFPGQVVSGGPGTGPYVVNIYPNGLASASEAVSVTQLELDASDTIPVNTWCMVVKVGPASAPLYYTQVPVWLS